jgi:MFS family permease
LSWHHEITREQWRVLFAAQLGWMLDAMDFLLYSFALTAIRADFSLSSAAAGALGAIPLATSAAGGVLFGYLSDRYGRARALGWAVLTFSILTAFTATSRNVGELVFWRAAAGIGLGGEWAAGSVLVAETWPERHRAKGLGLMQSGWAIGYMIAAILAAVILPSYGWRALFVVGLAPAVFTWWIRRSVPESPQWKRPERSPFGELLRPPLRGRVLVLCALCCCLLFGYWGVFTWLPAYLSTPVERGGAGLSIVRSSAWILPMQVGAFLGYVSFGFLADRLGRRPAFLLFVLSTAVLVPIYGLAGRSATILLAIGPLLGFFGHGYFSVIGSLAAEMFPPSVRNTAQGFCYNAGRGLAGFAPATVGALADRNGIGAALTVTSIFFVAGAAVMVWMTRRSSTRHPLHLESDAAEAP